MDKKNNCLKKFSNKLDNVRRKKYILPKDLILVLPFGDFYLCAAAMYRGVIYAACFKCTITC